jgi:hypothetical protein
MVLHISPYAICHIGTEHPDSAMRVNCKQYEGRLKIEAVFGSGRLQGVGR